MSYLLAKRHRLLAHQASESVIQYPVETALVGVVLDISS